MNIFLKKTTLSLSLLFFLLSTTPLLAQQGCLSVRDCPNGLACIPKTPGNGCTFTSNGLTLEDVGCCESATPNNPGFYLPRPTEIPELANFNFRWQSSKRSIGFIISKAIPYVFGISGLLLFFYLLYGAFLITSALGNAQKIAQGRTVMTQALLGYALLSSTYMIGLVASQLLGINFGVV